jgi:uncharacterized protein
MLSSLLGGALIGLAASIYWYANGRVAGVSGVVHGALREADARWVRIAFLGGLVVAGALCAFARAHAGGPAAATPTLAVAGLLVGFGTRVGGGCTSGHGVCGLSRLSLRSLVATMTFMAAGAATVFVGRSVR